MFRNTLFLFVLILVISGSLSAQPVYERHTHEVYNYLARMAQKGLLVFNDNSRPLSKTYIKSCLDSVALHISTLTNTEKKELEFYKKEFTEGERKRILAASGNGFTVSADPILTASYTRGGGRDIKSSSAGINLWGRIGKNWGYQFSFHDVNEKGKGLDTSGKTLFSGSATGMVRPFPYSTTRQSSSELRAGFRYEFSNGAVSIGQDYLTWGYGENGRLVLSDKAPVYPYIRLDYQPLSWLRFNYTHAWLRSNVIDSQASYPITGPVSSVRPVEVAKFMASHSVDITLARGLILSVGESIIYNDRLNVGYLIPIMFFKAYDHASSNDRIDKGSNGQFFFQLNSRNQIRNTHLYGTLFIDEIRAGSMFSRSKNRNQLGYTFGGSVTDPGIPYLTLGAEYTRIRPFVYRNFLEAQNYTHQNYLLGDWMGGNGDRAMLFARYTPLPRFKLYARYTHLRKGGPGTMEQQYNEPIQPPFLFDFQQASDEMFFNAAYECMYRLNLNINYRRFDNISLFGIGMAYGL